MRPVQSSRRYLHRAPPRYGKLRTARLSRCLLQPARVIYNCSVPLPILATKLFIPSPRAQVVRRRLTERLDTGMDGKLTLVSAPAGFGKTTLVSEWCHLSRLRTAWLSLDREDNDSGRFLAYLVTALQTIEPALGQDVLGILQTPQLPPIEAILTALVNELANVSKNFALVLDDYHVIDSDAVNAALAFLLEHAPPQMHLVIISRRDPNLPLAQLRARGQLTELHTADLRFTPDEAAEFLNRVMGLKLSAADVDALETRTEGWVAGLQLAALSMQGQKDTARHVESFTGSHPFVTDYLLDQVLQRQPERVQTFLLCTSILDRLCGPLCDAVLRDASGSGQATLEYLERANLFIVPLDNERRWYRYHQLFGDVLRRRLEQQPGKQPPEQNGPSSFDDAPARPGELHLRASRWYRDNDLGLEAFQHAVAANDIEYAGRLIEEKGMPLHLSGTVTFILNWLDSLPKNALDARPALWLRYASLLLVNGQTTRAEEKLQAAEAALQTAQTDDTTRNLIGRIAAARATAALTRYDSKTMLAESRRALEFLDADNLTGRASVNWTMGVAYMLQGNRPAAGHAYTQSISLSGNSGDTFTTILATIGLGNILEAETQLVPAAETYRQILQLAGDQPLQVIGEVHLALARILYEWNDLEGAAHHGQASLELEQRFDRGIDRFILCQVFLARVKLAEGDVEGASGILAETNRSARARNFVQRLPEIAAVRVQAYLRQGNLAEAAHLAQAHKIPGSQAEVYLAQGNPAVALKALERWRKRVQQKGWRDQELQALALQAVALDANEETEHALQTLREALTLAEPGGFVRLFVDQGLPMAQLMRRASARGIMPDYVRKLLAAFESEQIRLQAKSFPTSAQSLLEPLSEREMQVLRLIAQGLSNKEIGKKLFLALDTVKGHNRRIFNKLQVASRTEAIARARELGLF